MRETEQIVEGILAAESLNDQHRRPNPNGEYPLCIPDIKQAPNLICERCGGFAGYIRPCPAVPPEHRWGDDYIPGPPRRRPLGMTPIALPTAVDGQDGWIIGGEFVPVQPVDIKPVEG